LHIQSRSQSFNIACKLARDVIVCAKDDKRIQAIFCCAHFGHSKHDQSLRRRRCTMHSDRLELSLEFLDRAADDLSSARSSHFVFCSSA
jgi:hypothetical protein